MSQPVRTLLVIGACLVLAALVQPRLIQRNGAGPVAVENGGADYRLDADAARSAGIPYLAPEARARGFTFDPSATPFQRQEFDAAIAAARPEAQRLIALIDGLTRVTFAPLEDATAGRAATEGDGSYDVTIDFDRVWAQHGRRGVARVVLHELGHVVDFALVEDAVMARLDAEIPAGYPCAAGGSDGACAATEERFAESFAKWAMNDIGADLYIGYRVPPPVLATWGAPLAELAR